jgi:hypothetical protein
MTVCFDYSNGTLAMPVCLELRVLGPGRDVTGLLHCTFVGAASLFILVS